MNIEKYKNDGWGLSKKCFLDIKEILKPHNAPVVVEFGSGISTTFFKDLFNKYCNNGKIYSFDNDGKFASNISQVKRLVECSDKDFNLMFSQGKYNSSKMNYRTTPPDTRQKNCFYDLSNSDIPSNIDLVLVDGPHGNGRSFSFLHVKDKIKKGGYIVIDDFNHYDFVERLLMIFPNAKEITTLITERNKDSWEEGGNYTIYRV